MGHIVDDAEDGEDKLKKARLEQLEPWKWCNYTLTFMKF
jgi:hypothetical protein